MSKIMDDAGLSNKFNIADVLLLDHSYLKKCIKILKNKDEDRKIKLKFSKTFLDALYKHSDAEKRAVYAPLLKVKELHKEILEGEIEHEMIDTRVKMLCNRITGARVLSEELEIEMKVLADLVEHHLKVEESETIPTMKRFLDKTILNEMGFQFMKLRKFSVRDLSHYPNLQKEVPGLQKHAHRISGHFIDRVKKHVVSMAR